MKLSEQGQVVHMLMLLAVFINQPFCIADRGTEYNMDITVV